MNLPSVLSKNLVGELLEEVLRAPQSEVGNMLERFCHADCVWNIFHPFNTLIGNGDAARRFWNPLITAFPDLEFRAAQLLSGQYEGRTHVSTWGNLLGNFIAPWINIPPTQQLTILRFGLNAQVRGAKFERVHILFDLIDVMGQAGHYPLREMPGSPVQWPFPPGDAEFSLNSCASEKGARTLDIILEMQRGLPKGRAITDIESAQAAHSPHWHENMNWYGPAGIGSSRGLRGFRDYHGALFLKAFPDRSGIKREPEGAPDRPGDYIRIGDGRAAVTAGWPAMRGTHTGGQWLGLPPTGAKVEMRVADWYRLDQNAKIIDNWVMIDIPHMLQQMGLDIVDDVQFFADRSRSRLPQGKNKQNTD